MGRLGKLGLENLDRRKGEEDTASDQRASIQLSNLSDDLSDDLTKVPKPGNLFITF
jgi:hypothetical protein